MFAQNDHWFRWKARFAVTVLLLLGAVNLFAATRQTRREVNLPTIHREAEQGTATLNEVITSSHVPGSSLQRGQ